MKIPIFPIPQMSNKPSWRSFDELLPVIVEYLRISILY